MIDVLNFGLNRFFIFSKKHAFPPYFFKVSASSPLISCVHARVWVSPCVCLCHGAVPSEQRREKMPTNKPRCCPSLRPGFIPVSRQTHSRCFPGSLCACPGPRGGPWPGVFGGLNQVFSKFRWSGTEWLFSAQFKMIGLALPSPGPFRSATDFMTTKK